MARLEKYSEEERNHLLSLPCPRFESTPFVTGPPLSERKIALISTAGLHLRSDRPFGLGASDYRLIPKKTPTNDLVMSHISTNFDRTGFLMDVNLVFPLDRLTELAEIGFIGCVAGYHYSFMGATDPKAMKETAENLAEIMKKDGVNAVLLVPVWPNCTRAVGGLAHYIEEAGIPTTQISLIREHTEIIKPPRALWVPFDLGRPLGVPNNREFQTLVLKHALSLLESINGPVLEDFPDDAPAMLGQPLQVACPVSFSTQKAALSSTESLLDSFSTEFSQMTTWYDVALSKNKRTTTGVSGLLPEEAAEFISAFVKGEDPMKRIKNISLPDSLRMVAEDIKAIYFEGVSAQPGQPTDSKTLADWFWGETYAALVINEVRKKSLKDDSKKMKLLGSLLLIPRNQMHRFKK